MPQSQKGGSNLSAKGIADVPKGWPQDVAYLSRPVYSKMISPDVLEALHIKPPNTQIQPVSTGPSPYVKIIAIDDDQHPAHGQHGLFAAQHLLPGSFILFYFGFVHSQVDTDPNSDYDLSLDRELAVGIDATKMGNEARFINDYRGINAVGPNVEFKEVWVDLGKGKTERRMAVYVLSAGKSRKRSRGIQKGEEILLSYGKGFWKERYLEGLDN